MGPDVVPERGFFFRSSDHTYWLDGLLIPGCTTVISKALRIDEKLSKIPQGVLANARERGEKVHLACQYFDEGTLDVNTLDLGLLGRFQSWVAFREQEDFYPYLDWSEKPTWHTTWKYGCTPDRFGYFGSNAREKWRHKKAVVEMKNTWSNEKYWSLQTASQVEAIKSQGLDITPESIIRLAVNLGDDGYRLVEHTDQKTDFRRFMSCLTVYTMIGEMT